AQVRSMTSFWEGPGVPPRVSQRLTQRDPGHCPHQSEAPAPQSYWVFVGLIRIVEKNWAVLAWRATGLIWIGERQGPQCIWIEHLATPNSLAVSVWLIRIHAPRCPNRRVRPQQPSPTGNHRQQRENGDTSVRWTHLDP